MSRCAGLLVAAACITAACGPSGNVEQERNALIALDREWSQSANNVEKFASYYAAEASLYPHGMPIVKGAGPIKETLTHLAAMPGFALTITPGKADVGGDIGYTAGVYELTANDPGGKPAVEKGKYVAVWKKQADGQWKVVEDIFNADAAPPDSSQHVMVEPKGGITWHDPPPGLPPGAKVAVLSGDPTQPGQFVLRAQLPAGYKVAPHWHATAEHVTVLSGTLAVGMGDKFDQAAMKDMPASSYVALPAEMRHYVQAKSATTIQIHGRGPFAITYVDAADDPRK